MGSMIVKTTLGNVGNLDAMAEAGFLVPGGCSYEGGSCEYVAEDGMQSR